MSDQPTGAGKSGDGRQPEAPSSSLSPATLYDLFAYGAVVNPEAVAIAAIERPPLTYAGLMEQVRATGDALNGLGLGPGDRVAIVLPNGAEMATAFLSVAACATAAPLNPGYGVDEFDFYLDDLSAKALIVEAGTESAATIAAGKRGVPVIALASSAGTPAGVFELRGRDRAAPRNAGRNGPEDAALVLHTSGTTARPKRVPLTHANLCRSAENVGRALSLASADRCLNIMPLFHIHGLVAALLASLRAGASVVCAPGFFAPRFFEWVAEFHPTWYTAVPTMHQSILAQSSAHRATISACPLRFIRSSSAALAPKVMADLEKVFGAPVIEAYGMTEASHQIADNPLPPAARKPGSVGRAAGPEVAIMDAAGRLLDPGQTGEIVLRGGNVTKGYENNPSANESAFTQGQRGAQALPWFRTGDQGCLDAEGYLFITGRLKELINRGGEKISPREVDEALLGHPAIAQAVTFAMPDARLGEDVAAAVVLKPNAEASEREIREFAAARIAAFKVPRRVLIVQDVPKGPTGKIQRVGLAERLGLKGESEEPRGPGAEYVAPRTPLERELAQLWAGILRLERIGIHDVFVRLGGDSILAALLVSRIRDKFAVELSLISLFDEAATIAGMAQQIEKAPRLGAGPAIPPLRRDDSERAMPLSCAQQSWWFFHEFEPDARLCNVLFAYRLRGALDVPALELSLHELVRRHALLRTVYRAEDDRLTQRPVSDQAVSLTRSDVAGGSVAEALRLHREDARLRFSLAKGPPIRAALLRLAPDDHMLALTLHHIASDAWSEVVLRRELAALCQAFSRGAPSPLPPLPLQYADFALWQQEFETSPLFARKLAYWKDRFTDAPPSCDLGRSSARKAARTFSSAHRSLDLPGDLLRRLEKLSRREGVSLFVALVAAFKLLLHRHTAQTDIVVGTPVAGRNRTELEGLIGCFANILALRTDLSGDVTFRELLQRVQRTVLGALEHQDVPFEKVLEAVRPARGQDRRPLVGIVFEFLNLPAEPPADGALNLERLEIEPEASPFDAHLCVEPKDGGLHCALTCNAALFDEPEMDRMLGHFRTLLEAIAADGAERKISDLPLLTEPERRQLLAEWNDTRADFPCDKTIPQLFEEQAARSPEAVAAVFQEEALTYRQLNARANRLAHRLRKSGCGPDALVAIGLDRSLDMPVALMGAMKSGAPYVPLDPEHPPARLQFMLQDSGAKILVTHERLLPKWRGYAGEILCLDRDAAQVESEPEDNPPLVARPDPLAYVAYTSGSTGRPKGVLIGHRGLVNFLAFLAHAYSLGGDDVVLHLPSFAWDASVDDFLGPLTTGGRVVVVSDPEAKDPNALLDRIQTHRVTALLSAGPALLDALADAALVRHWRCDSLRLIITAGEELRSPVCRKARDAFGGRVRLSNHYGPTECTCAQTWHPLAADAGEGVIPIGRPIWNQRVYILDARLQPVPIGVTGEIYITGPGLAKGYLNRPELTAERFIADPFSETPGARLYKTGDLGRYRPDGAIEFLGRLDFQVKLRGHRIELGEIEAALGRHPAVKAAVVAVREDAPERKRLAAFVVAKGPMTPSAAELRQFLETSLPDYMIPATFTQIASLPLTPTGKVDRRALQASDVLHGPQLEAAYRVPRTPVEEMLAAIWAAVLRVSRVGAEDNFFELGGHSLLAAGIISRVAAECEVTLTLREFFEAPTVAGMSLRSVNRMAERLAPDDLARMLDELAPESASLRLREHG